MLKKNKLRYNEYYDMQHIYDELYAQSKNGNNFYKLLEIIGSEQNICLAYRLSLIHIYSPTFHD